MSTGKLRMESEDFESGDLKVMIGKWVLEREYWNGWNRNYGLDSEYWNFRICKVRDWLVRIGK